MPTSSHHTSGSASLKRNGYGSTFLCGTVSILCGLVFSSWLGVVADTRDHGNGFVSFSLKTDAAGQPGFTLMDASMTGLTFTNSLTGDLSLTNAVAHNGSGLALGDVDGDGWVDLYFCGLQGPNRLYKNLGAWRFVEMQIGSASCDGQLSTAACLVDIDGDRDLDLLVNGIAAGTRLFLNDGKGHWTELEDSGLSGDASPTSMALADIDGDGDLDLYCAHYIDIMHLADPTTRFALARREGGWEVSKVNGQSTQKPPFKGRFQILPDGSVRELPEPDGLYLNQGDGRFVNISNEQGVFKDWKGKPMPPPRDWGLAVIFHDLNQDGSPDLYVCNDNASPDRVWINEGRGTFRELEPSKIRHTSRSSMAVDVADVDRDGWDDVFVVDMLAREHARRMTQLVRDSSDESEIHSLEAVPRFNRNTLFLGRGDGSFVEAALMAGLAATEWTWCPAFMDVDLDGDEDLLVTNGFSFDVMDQDSHDRLRGTRMSTADLKRSRQFHPAWPSPNLAFRNHGDGTFQEVGSEWGFDLNGISYGMALGDLDNDGDLDVAINHLNDAAAIYRNNASADRIKVILKGIPPNSQGIGSRVEWTESNLKQHREVRSGGRYLSCDEAAVVFPVSKESGADRLLKITWPDGRQSMCRDIRANRVYVVEPTSKPPSPSTAVGDQTPYFTEITMPLSQGSKGTAYLRPGMQPLMPAHFNHHGPGVSWVDMDDDGWEDLLVGSGQGGPMGVCVNDNGHGFKPLNRVSTKDGPTAGVGWVDAHGIRKWLAASMSDDSSPARASVVLALNPLQPDPSEPWARTGNRIGPVCVADIDGDGDLDAFVGGISYPGRYPESSPSFVLYQESSGDHPSHPRSVSLGNPGIVNAATFFDLEGDGDCDLALALEWGSILIYQNTLEGFVDVTGQWGLASFKGWWTGLAAGDFNGDGRLDLAVGNWGRNGPYALYPTASFRLWYGDGNGDGMLELVETWLGEGQWLPMLNRNLLSKGFPDLPVRFPTHRRFAAAAIEGVLGDHFARFKYLEADRFDSTVFLNQGDHFEPLPLPPAAQMAPVFSVSVMDFDADGCEDLFLSQNIFGDLGDLTREDGGNGCLLRGRGDGSFETVGSMVSGIRIAGQQRGSAVADCNHDARVDLAVADADGSVKVYLNQYPKQGIRVSLNGLPTNPDGIGARLRVLYQDGRMGPVRMVSAGSGYRSQDAAQQVMGYAERPVGIWVGRPSGSSSVLRLAEDQWEAHASMEE